MSTDQAVQAASETTEFLRTLAGQAGEMEYAYGNIPPPINVIEPGVSTRIVEFYNQSPHHKALALMTQASVPVTIANDVYCMGDRRSIEAHAPTPRQQIPSFCAGDHVTRYQRRTHVRQVKGARTPEWLVQAASVFGHARRGTLWVHVHGVHTFGPGEVDGLEQGGRAIADAICDFTRAALENPQTPLCEGDEGTVDLSTVSRAARNSLWIGVTLRNHERHQYGQRGRPANACLFCGQRFEDADREWVREWLRDPTGHGVAPSLPLRDCRGCGRSLSRAGVLTAFRDDEQIDATCGPAKLVRAGDVYRLVRKANQRRTYRLLSHQRTANALLNGPTVERLELPVMMTHLHGHSDVRSPATTRKASLIALASEFLAGTTMSVMFSAPLGDARKVYDTALAMADSFEFQDQLQDLGVEVIRTPALAQNPREHYHHVDSMVLAAKAYSSRRD